MTGYNYSSKQPTHISTPATMPTMPDANRRHSTASPAVSPADLKKKAISCLNKLSDRDTFVMASAELETMAVSLSPDCYAPFLSCIYHTDATHKSPARRQCVRLLTTLARTHSDRLAPFLPKMLLSIIRRLRDADSSVRSACVDAVSAAAASVTAPPFSSAFLKPLSDAVVLEQDVRLQAGAALCLAAAVDASPSVEPVQLQRVLPRFVKLLRSDAFKAKPALLAAVASFVRAGGACSPGLVAVVVPALVDLLGSADWAARKAAAEALLTLAEAERDLVGEFKDGCLAQFEARRFDKVKAVRDSMNRMIQAWKQVNDVSNPDNSHPDQSKENFDIPAGIESSIPPNKKSNEARRPSLTSFTSKIRRNKPDSEWKIEVAVPLESGSKKTQAGRVKSLQSRLDVKRILFDNNGDDKKHKLKNQSRVAPLPEKENTGSTPPAVVNATDESYPIQKDGGELSLIRKQLVQIETQQANLLDMLQKFIGSSQNGMRSLEGRVRGLEMALDEISRDLAASAARMSNCDRAESTAKCCRLPGAELLSSKFWRRIDLGYLPKSRCSTSVGATGDNLDKGRFRNPGGLVVNPLAEVHSIEEPNSRLNHELGCMLHL